MIQARMYADMSHKHINTTQIHLHIDIDIHTIHTYGYSRINTHTYIHADILINDKYLSALDRLFTPHVKLFISCFK